MSEQPDFIPYGSQGSGDAGNETSRERRIAEDANGISSDRRRHVFWKLSQHGRTGLTVGELEDLTGLGHGQASSALSHLHRAGKVRRLTEKRKKQQVYVAPAFVEGREESPYRPRYGIPESEVDQLILEAKHDAWQEGLEAGAEDWSERPTGPTNPYRLYP